MLNNKSELRRFFLHRRAQLGNKRIKELNLNNKLFDLLKKKKEAFLLEVIIQLDLK